MTELADYARKVATCVYIAVDKDVADDISGTIHKLLARLAEVEKALEPFAKAGGQLPLTDYRNDPIAPDEEVWLSCIGLSPEPLTVADFARARAALHPKGE